MAKAITKPQMKVVHKGITKKQILFYGDFDCASGFAQVSKNLIDNWSEDKNVMITVFALNNHKKESYNYKDNVLVIPALSTSKDKKDYYARIEFLNLLYQYNFDVLFMLNDIELANGLHEHILKVKNEKRVANKPSFKSVIYFPIDSEPRPSDLKVLSFFDEVVTYTEYAKGVMKVLVSETQFNKIKVIPHGVDTEVFYPIELTDNEKQKALGIKKDSMPFVFGTVNRNSSRKDLATLILGFAIFKHSSQADAVLYLHCNPNDPSGINVERLCERVGLEIGTDVFLPKNFNENKGIDSAELNRIYNSFDCFVTTTTAEGWGLSVTEAMATKCLVLCPKHTSLTEITDNGENAVCFTFSQQAVFVNDFEKIRFISNPPEVAHVLGIAYNLKNDTEEIKEMVVAKLDRAYNKILTYNWKQIASQFKTIIDKLAK